MLFTCTIASTQSKVGYINFEQLVSQKWRNHRGAEHRRE